MGTETDEFPNANSHQVGGTHYQADYQHWDLVADTGMGYFEAQITRYVARWRKKDGLKDLEKALHYCDKLIQLIKERRQPLERLPSRAETWQSLILFTKIAKLTWTEELIFELCIARNTWADLERLRRYLEQLQESKGGV